jgi:hypothetical protein
MMFLSQAVVGVIIAFVVGRKKEGINDEVAFFLMSCFVVQLEFDPCAVG